jgi:hypothetical protein
LVPPAQIHAARIAAASGGHFLCRPHGRADGAPDRGVEAIRRVSRSIATGAGALAV